MNKCECDECRVLLPDDAPIVEVSEGYTDCDHDGCSGGETKTITVQLGDRTVSVSAGGCFGYCEQRLIAELIHKITKGER